MNMLNENNVAIDPLNTFFTVIECFIGSENLSKDNRRSLPQHSKIPYKT